MPTLFGRYHMSKETRLEAHSFQDPYYIEKKIGPRNAARRERWVHRRALIREGRMERPRKRRKEGKWKLIQWPRKRFVFQ